MTTESLRVETEKFIASTPTSKRLQQEASEYLPGGSSRGTAFFAPYPTFVDRGEGLHVYDVDGNRYLDFMINATSLVLGHAHPDVVRVLQEQAAKGTAFSGPTEAQIRLAKILCDRVPSVDTIRFTNSGTEGTMMAIRAARAFTGRHKIAKIEGGYHGSHEYVSVSVYPSADKLDPNETTPIPEHAGQPPSIAEDVFVLPFNDLETSQRVLRQHKDEIGCVIMEPIVSHFGYLPGKRDYLQGMRKITEELDMVLIFDEVQSFRLAPGGAQEAFGVIPDMTTFGKIIGGGMAVGAFGGRRDIMDQFDPTKGDAMAHAGTFNANPMTMLAGEVVMNHLTPEVYDRMNALGEMLRQKLRAVFDELEVDVQVTGIGSMFGMHFTADEVVNYRDVVRSDHTMQKAVFTGLLNEGVLLQAACHGALSALTTEAEVDELVDAIRRVVQRVR
ncbi:MAG: aspartate aminotransferase family protein [Chloroflexi bacterium]|nr:aspartate aminotransferase family protein [Chloroflexota bacterium]MDA1227140.1 aspartate aminotransferase family protein [Chloroflexota bacterium]